MQYSLSYTRGRLDLSANANNAQGDKQTAQTNGGFDRLNLSLSRLQRLTAETTLIASLSGQWASKNLDSGEKFSLGGANGVRAYPGLEASGDQGWLFNLELRHQWSGPLQLSVFFDHGRIQLNKSPWNGWNAGNTDLPNNYSLQGIGLGLTWVERGDYSLRLQYAGKLGQNRGHSAQGKDSDGTNDNSRLWLNAVKLF